MEACVFSSTCYVATPPCHQNIYVYISDMEKTLLVLTGSTLQFHTLENQSGSQGKMRQVASTLYFWRSTLKASLLSHLITNLLDLLATKSL